MKMYTTRPGTKPEDLDERRIYRFKARNFFIGVWNGRRDDMCGFIGIREKFSSRYLFTEYHCDTGGSVGTVWNIEPTDYYVPEGIELVEYLGSFCRVCEKPVEGVPGEKNGRQVQNVGDTHVDPADRTCSAEGTYCGYFRSNKDLFDFLKPFSDEVAEEHRIEDEKATLARESRAWRPKTEAEWNREQAVAVVMERRSERIAELDRRRIKEGLTGDALKEASRAASDTFMEEFADACQETPIPEEKT